MDLVSSEAAPANFLKLPVEIIIQILSYLDVGDLYNIAETCQALNHIINDEELWKNLFIKRFHTNHFSSVSKSYKFSVELFERIEIIHCWKKSTGTHRIFTIDAMSIEKVILDYPKLLSFSDRGDINIASLDRGKTDTSIPMTTPTGCTSYSFNTYASVFGRIDGKIYGKLLATKSYLSSITEFNKTHEGMVTAIHNDDLKCYSGDEKGTIFTWSLKTGEFLKEYKVSNDAVMKIQGYNDLIVGLDSKHIHIIENDVIRSIPYSGGADFFEVDFSGGIVIVGNVQELSMYSYHRSSFGRLTKLSVGDRDEIWKIGLEKKTYSSSRDLKIAGYDGCNLGVVTRLGRVMSYNIRDLRLRTGTGLLQPQCEITPIFDTLRIPEGIPPISSISINSTVVLLGSYNGFAAVYEVLTGEFVKLVSNRIPKRYLPLTEPPYLIPVKFVELSPKNQTNGILIVNNVVQYFQFGKALHELQRSQKKKKSLAGVSGDRKDKLMKKIKHEVDEMHYESYEQYKEDLLLDKYNGNDAEDQEQIELAMALNRSMNETPNDIDIKDGDDIDEELLRALELSKLEHKFNDSANVDEFDLTVERGGQNGNNSSRLGNSSRVEAQRSEEASVNQLVFGENSSNDDGDYESQIQEALRRSLYE